MGLFITLEVSQISKDNLADIPQSNVAEIRFDKVSFDYDIRRTIIKNISFTVPNGKKVAIVEKENLGGVCLNWGCIPTKALLKSAQVFEYINHAEDYGITVKDAKATIAKVKKINNG